jgi:hypothetical protein
MHPKLEIENEAEKQIWLEFVCPIHRYLIYVREQAASNQLNLVLKMQN